jgi:hypothetical protein
MLNLCGIVAAILKIATSRNFSMSGINSGYHYLPTFQMTLLKYHYKCHGTDNDRNVTMMAAFIHKIRTIKHQLLYLELTNLVVIDTDFTSSC